MNESKVKRHSSADATSQSGTSKLGGMLSGRLGSTAASYSNPDKAFDEMLRGTSPETRNSGELAFVPLDTLLPFPSHPFKLYKGAKLNELAESIKEIGVVNAIIARKSPEQPGKFQILSGHNRVNAARMAGLKQIKVEIVDVDDDTAALIVVDSNFKQRETILPSERAFGFKMQMDALRHQGKRTDLIADENQSIKARDTIGKENGLSGFQITNYIRLTSLAPELLEKVDANQIPLKAGIVLSYIDLEKQALLLRIVIENGYGIDHNKAQKLKDIHLSGVFTEEAVKRVFEEESLEKSISLKLTRKELHRFFPEEMKTKDMISRIFRLLEKYSHELDT